MCLPRYLVNPPNRYTCPANLNRGCLNWQPVFRFHLIPTTGVPLPVMLLCIFVVLFISYLSSACTLVGDVKSMKPFPILHILYQGERILPPRYLHPDHIVQRAGTWSKLFLLREEFLLYFLLRFLLLFGNGLRCRRVMESLVASTSGIFWQYGATLASARMH